MRHLIDFERLNTGDPRITICATDLESGNAVLFDSLSERIDMDHIQLRFSSRVRTGASDGRWLGDVGFSLNAPFEPVLESRLPLRLYVIDLFARDGRVPDGLDAAAERKSDLDLWQRDIPATPPRPGSSPASRRAARLVHEEEIYLLSYRPGLEEAGPEKFFDLSETAMAQRWRAAFLDMRPQDWPQTETGSGTCVGSLDIAALIRYAARTASTPPARPSGR
ncbi:hypothetical protein NLM27_42775 [Bradyrhizobium sp. CCGB12]|uniref:hypothetical protein n=1 Tax=Bradyrhizobium sp. CCGB12 TaxID=2949632 RepID=UPI0020B28EEF|nr:hypothetical protein [Bradyrhizobium sp. CCGB12]MCP3395438.1 hypothetical protein [Bradyrhizobium sp. CCGB12]